MKGKPFWYVHDSIICSVACNTTALFSESAECFQPWAAHLVSSWASQDLLYVKKPLTLTGGRPASFLLWPVFSVLITGFSFKSSASLRCLKPKITSPSANTSLAHRAAVSRGYLVA